jgi:methyl-accepting chemotaxis protein
VSHNPAVLRGGPREDHISTKIGAMIAPAGLCLACTCAAALDFSYQRMTTDRIRKARAVADMAANLAESLQRQVQAGTLTRDAASVRFRETVAAQRFDGSVPPAVSETTLMS